MNLDGIYRLYHIRYDGDHKHKRLMSRFMIQNGVLHHLEDHFNNMDELLPSGPVTSQHAKRITELSRSGYHELKREDDINEGHHDEDLEELDLGDAEPDVSFIMEGNGQNPEKLEIYGDDVFVEGKKLDPEDADKLMQDIRNGKVMIQQEN